MKLPIYLDYNATTPIDKHVAEAMQPFLQGYFGNPSSSHPYGVQARLAIDLARNRVASLLNVGVDEIVFTSGGTEANNMAIRGYCLQHRQRGNHIITSAVEHPAVLDVCTVLAREGFRLTVLDVDRFGVVDPNDLIAALSPETILVSIMHANNEVGSIQPIHELVEITHQSGAVFHCDAAQSVGKIPVDVKKMGVDLLSVAGHKFYAPKGIGVLYIRNGTTLTKITQGANHESNRRPGTENTLAIAGLGAAAELVTKNITTYHEHFGEMRDRLEHGITAALGEERVRVNGHPQLRLPNTSSLSFRNVQANRLLTLINSEVAASAGAACHADQVAISSVLSAMQVPLEWAMGTVRFSVGRATTKEEIDQAVESIVKAVMTMLN